MPLRCINDNGDSIQSFALDEAQWSELHQTNAKRRHLRMACCATPAVLKTSKLGTRFFAHAKRGECTTAPESEHHLTLKTIAARAIRACGWNVATEVPGQTPAGDWWIADVLATRGNARVAVEIQWSTQTNEETLRRQERYRLSGVRGLWLLHQPGFPVTHKLPAACIHLDDDTGQYMAMIPRYTDMAARDRKQPARWLQTMAVEAFIRSAFSSRLSFGKVKQGGLAQAQIYGAWVKCWRCTAWTRAITCVAIQANGETFEFFLDALDEDEANLIGLNQLQHAKVGKIKRRYSKTENAAYLSNGCIACDALQGQHFLRALEYRSEVFAEYRLPIDANITALINSHYFPHWHVSAV